MTLEEIAKYYNLPLQIVDTYPDEFIVNTPDTPEYAAAKASWDGLNAYGWGWNAGSQDNPGNVGVTAFSPPPAYTTNVTGRGAWMLRRLHDGDLAYYEINFSGYI